MPDLFWVTQSSRCLGDDHFSDRNPLKIEFPQVMNGFTHWRRVFSVSKKEINFNWSTRWVKALLIAAIASLFGLSCLTKLLEENDARRMRFSIPARSAPWWGVPKNTTPLIAPWSEAYSGLLYASIIAYHSDPFSMVFVPASQPVLLGYVPQRL